MGFLDDHIIRSEYIGLTVTILFCASLSPVSVIQAFDVLAADTLQRTFFGDRFNAVFTTFGCLVMWDHLFVYFGVVRMQMLNVSYLSFFAINVNVIVLYSMSPILRFVLDMPSMLAVSHELSCLRRYHCKRGVLSPVNVAPIYCLGYRSLSPAWHQAHYRSLPRSALAHALLSPTAP